MEEFKRSDYVAEINGKEVFTTRYSVERERHLLRIIDRAEIIAAASLVLSILSIILILAS